MSTELQEAVEMGTKPVKEHEWLQRLVGEWRMEAEFNMGPDAPKGKATGTDSVKSLGGLWAISEGKGQMPDGQDFTMYTALGYDVSFEDNAAAGTARCLRTYGSTRAS